jgi:uncharacterized protein (DUF2235 family)
LWEYGAHFLNLIRKTNESCFDRDTVSSVGIVRKKKSLPQTVDGMWHVCVFRHALALDERRVKFLPEYANGGRSFINYNWLDRKELWFIGTHSDMCVKMMRLTFGLIKPQRRR